MIKAYNTGETPDLLSEDIKNATEYEKPFLEEVKRILTAPQSEDLSARQYLLAKSKIEQCKRLSHDALAAMAANLWARVQLLEESIEQITSEKAISKNRHALRAEVSLLHKGAKFKTGRPIGANSTATKHIFDLVLKFPNLSAKQLYTFADTKIIGEMSHKVFANNVSNAKKAQNTQRRRSKS